jgi:hypothetical protein
MRKYTVNGSDAIEQKIASDMEVIVKQVTTVLPQSDLLAIILGGGYGRGEGGVRIQDGIESLYNDYDFFIISKDLLPLKAKRYQKQLRALSHELGKQIGIEVDFSPIQPISALPKADFWLVWYELKYGHQVVWGKPNILRYLPQWQGEDIPLEEAAKLLLNRGVGLALAKEKLDSEGFDPKDEFVTRNIFKAVMAMGDAILMSEKIYHWSYQERLRRFQSLEHHTLVARYNLLQPYSETIQYKLNPFDVNYDKQGFQTWYNEILSAYMQVYYSVFSVLLKAHILDSRTYLAHLESSLYLQMDTKSALKNMALNMRDHKGKSFQFDLYLRYPRYRLFYCLPWFLFHEKCDLYRIDAILGLPEHSPEADRRKQFLSLWSMYN